MADKESKDGKDTKEDKKDLMKKTAKAGLKWKKKNWYRLIAPVMFQSKEVGETFAEDSSKLMGRTIDSNLFQLTGNIKKQSIGVTLQVNEVKNDQGHTYIKDFHLQPSNIRKMSRKEMSKIEDSFVCLTSDKRQIRMKPILTTRSKANAKALKSLRKVARNIIIKRVNSLSYEKLMEDLVNLNIQKLMKDPLEKIFPLKQCQIKYAGLENDTRAFIVSAEDLSAVENKENQEQPRKKRSRKKAEEDGQSEGSTEEETSEEEDSDE